MPIKYELANNCHYQNCCHTPTVSMQVRGLLPGRKSVHVYAVDDNDDNDDDDDDDGIMICAVIMILIRDTRGAARLLCPVYSQVE